MCVTILVLCSKRLGICGRLNCTHPDTHFCKQSFPLGAFLGTGFILDDSGGPRRVSTHPCVCEQLLGSTVSIASVRVGIRPTESKNKPKAHSWSKYTTKICTRYDDDILKGLNYLVGGKSS